MTETSNLLTWDPEILRQLKLSIDSSIKDVSSAVNNRQKEMNEAEEISRPLLSLWEVQIDCDMKRMENLIAAKAAITVALRQIERESKALMN